MAPTTVSFCLVVLVALCLVANSVALPYGVGMYSPFAYGGLGMYGRGLYGYGMPFYGGYGMGYPFLGGFGLYGKKYY